MIVQFRILSRFQLEDYTPAASDAVVVVLDPPLTLPPAIAHHHRLCVLQFLDILEPLRRGDRLLYPMRYDDAVTFLRFLGQQAHSAKRLVVSCHAGVARSPALAIASAGLLGFHGTAMHLAVTNPYFNPHVLKTTIKAYQLTNVPRLALEQQHTLSPCLIHLMDSILSLTETIREQDHDPDVALFG